MEYSLAMKKILFSSKYFPEKDRTLAFREIYADIASVEMEPYPDEPCFIDMEAGLLPNLEICKINISSHIARRTRTHVATETQDGLALIISVNSSARFDFQNAAPVEMHKGGLILLPSDSVHTVDSIHPGEVLVINCPQSHILRRVKNLARLFKKGLRTEQTPELMLLKNYVVTLLRTSEELSPELTQLASSQIMDLMVLLMGAKSDEAEVAGYRGLRAARMLAIKQDIQCYLTDDGLSINQVAKRLDISPQYIRALFRQEQTTFGDYVNAMRLEQAYRLLTNPLCRHMSISTIAYQLGFNNISWFNCLFKKQFGLTPTETRQLVNN